MNSHNSEPEREVHAGYFLTLFLEPIQIQLPRPGLPSLAIEFDYCFFNCQDLECQVLELNLITNFNSIAKAWNTKSCN